MKPVSLALCFLPCASILDPRPLRLVSRSSFLLDCQLNRHLDGIDHGLRVGPAFASFPKGHAVIYGGTDDGQTQGHVNPTHLIPLLTAGFHGKPH